MASTVQRLAAALLIITMLVPGVSASAAKVFENTETAGSVVELESSDIKLPEDAWKDSIKNLQSAVIEAEIAKDKETDKELFLKTKEYLGKKVTLEGWIKNHRKQKEFGFIDFNDGTCFKSVQVVYDNKLSDFEDIQKIKIGSSVTITGKIVDSPKEGQKYEMQLEKLAI